MASALLVATAVSNAAAPRGLLDHALCCGLGPSSINGEGGFDPAADPLLGRHRLPPPGAIAAPVAAAVSIPGSDTFASELPAAATATATSGDTASAAPAVEPAVPAAPLRVPTEMVEGHLRVGFDVLGGYPFKLSKEAAAAGPAADVLPQIPDVIRQLDGRKVLVTGFMLPMTMEGTLTTEFLLVANSMLCCYGVVPPMNQWMVVKMARGGVRPQQDVPLSFLGILRVQPRYDDGALSAIYHLDAERIWAPKS